MIEYEEWLFKLIFRSQGSVGLRAAIFAFPAGLFAVILLILKDQIEDFWGDTGIDSITGSQSWAAATGVLTILLGFRTRQALSRFWEGTGLLHQMRGEWFDSVSCCVTFSRSSIAAKPEQVADFRHTIVRLMSLCHGSALEEIAQSTEAFIPVIDLQGLDKITLAHLYDCKVTHKFNRVEVILHLIQTLITKNLDTGGGQGVLKIPPPILSRVYQTLSRGFVNLLNAKKITDTRFPFPYAQLIAMLLLLHTVLTPTMIAQLIENKVWAAIFTFVPIFGMFSLNFVASELENPFGDDANDLPLERFQEDMNGSLLMLLHSNTDHIASISDRCITDFTSLKELLHADEEDETAVCKTITMLKSGSAGLPAPTSLAGLDGVSAWSQSCSNPTSPRLSSTIIAGGIDPSAFAATEPKLQQPAKPEDPQMRLVKGMDEFNSALQSWTKMVDGQIGELSRSFAALKKISDTVPQLVEAVQAGRTQWKKAMQEEATVKSLQAFPAL